jgi:hypothetical protein
VKNVGYWLCRHHTSQATNTQLTPSIVQKLEDGYRDASTKSVMLISLTGENWVFSCDFLIVC